MMIDTYTEQDLSLIVHGDDDLRCQSTHEPDDIPGGDVCSISVVALKSHCSSSFFICLNSYEWNLLVLDENDYCDGCDRPVRDCWEVRPI